MKKLISLPVLGILLLSTFACSDPRADAEKIRRIQIQDSLNQEITKTRARIDSLIQANDSLIKHFEKLGVPLKGK